MSYDHRAVARKVTNLLTLEPGRSLESISAELHVDRHTIWRALDDAGTSFSRLQTDMMLTALDEILRQGRTMSWKEMAAVLGCSRSSLSRWIARHERVRQVKWLLAANDYREKPLLGEELASAIEEMVAMHRRIHAKATQASQPASAGPENYASARWADAVWRGITAHEDFPTLHAWGHTIGSSVGALKSRCRMAGVSCRRSLLLARLGRAVVQAQQSGYRPQESLNVIDPRTLESILRLAGLRGDLDHFPTTLEAFFDAQQLVRDARALTALSQHFS